MAHNYGNYIHACSSKKVNHCGHNHFQIFNSIGEMKKLTEICVCQTININKLILAFRSKFYADIIEASNANQGFVCSQH